MTCSGEWGEPTLRYGFHPLFLSDPRWGRTPRPLALSGLVPTGCLLPLLMGLPLRGAGVGGVGWKERPYSPRAWVKETEPGPSWGLMVPRRPQLGSPPSAHTHPWCLAAAETPMELLLLGQMAGNHGVQKIS